MNKLMYMNAMINNIVWGKYMIAFLLFVGAWFMLRTGFLPFHKIGLIFRKTLGSLRSQNKQDGVTPFQAVSTALAGTLGVGSIVGVTTALTIGGPGSLFWMCISAVFGMMSKYAEVVLSIHYRQREKDGTYIGGPMTTWEHGLHIPFIGVLFALLCIFASFGIGNVTPANTIATTITTYVQIPTLWIGIVLAVLVFFIIRGKAKAIMRVNEVVIPIISIAYIIACVYLISLHMDTLCNVLEMIMKDAFSFSSAGGGIGGFVVTRAMHYGISRGVFSNEAGMGSSPIAHASVSNVNAVEQGFWGIFEVFFDTIVVCSLTGIMILSCDAFSSGLDGVALTVACFEEGFGALGGILFAISILAFAIPSILGWYFYASECIRYLFKGKWMLHIYQCLFIICIVLGCIADLRFVWEVADTLNGLMAIPNLISLVFLYKVVLKLTKEYMTEHGSD